MALLDDRAGHREMIEEFVARIHADDRGRIIANLRNEKQFLSTLGELIVGEIFIRAGEYPRYEPRLTVQNGTCTPDWLIDSPIRIVCDVFTAGLQRMRDADETSLRELEARLTDIRLPYVLKLEVNGAGALTPHDRKQIAVAVERWLSTQPGKAAYCVVDRAELQVMSISGNHVTVITAEGMHIVETPSSVRENFAEKTKKYAALALPLIVAAVKHNHAEIDTIDLENVLFGQEAYVSYIPGTGGTTRLAGGVFFSRPELSAAIWVEPFHLPPVIHVRANPIAAKPLPPDLLSRLMGVELPSW